MRLAGCLTVPSKPTKKTRQGLAAKALQQAQEQLRHGQGAASRAPPRWTQAQWHGVQKATEKGPNRDARRVPNGTFETHEEDSPGPRSQSKGAPLDPSAVARRAKKGTEKEPKIEASRVPNGTFETHEEDSPGPRSQSPAASTRAAKARPGRSQPGRPPLDPSAVARRAKRDRKRAEN